MKTHQAVALDKVPILPIYKIDKIHTYSDARIVKSARDLKLLKLFVSSTDYICFIFPPWTKFLRISFGQPWNSVFIHWDLITAKEWPYSPPTIFEPTRAEKEAERIKKEKKTTRRPAWRFTGYDSRK